MTAMMIRSDLNKPLGFSLLGIEPFTRPMSIFAEICVGPRSDLNEPLVFSSKLP